MKKIFKLTDAEKNADRVVESVKNDIRKYVKREKKKDLPSKEKMYWDFDCKIGATAATAKVVVYEELTKELDVVRESGVTEVYVEILAKLVNKPQKEKEVPAEEE